MTKQQLIEEFVKEINTGQRSVFLKQALSALDEELLNAAYLEAIDTTRKQQTVLSGLSLEASISTGGISQSTFFSAQQLELLSQFNALATLLDIENNGIFFVKVDGNSMIKANIHNGDILIANKATTAPPGAIVIAKVNSNYYIKRYKIVDNAEWLFSESDMFEPVKITSSMDFQIIGKVHNVIKNIM